MNSGDCITYGTETIPIIIKISAKRRTVGLSVRRSGDVILRIPQGYPKEDALLFAQKKSEWISKHLNTYQSQQFPVRMYHTGDTISFLGTEYTIQRQKGKVLRAAFVDSSLIITVPESFSEDEVSESARVATIYLFRREGTARLLSEVSIQAKRCGVEVPHLRIWEQSSKWGCCTPKNGIILNVNCLLAPKIVIEYLIIHEVSHLKYRNHQQEFWNEVRRLMPDYEIAERLLKSDGWKWKF